MKFLLSIDDGSNFDLKLAELLKKYNLTATFFIPSNCELKEDDILKLHKDGHKIGGHTKTHYHDLKKLTKEEQKYEMLSNKQWLEEIIKEEVTDFCYPKGKYNSISVEALKEVGFKTARTTVTGNIEMPEDLFRIRTSVHVYPSNARFNKPDWYKCALSLYKKAKKNNGYFHIWMHSWELQKFDLWDELEDFFKFIKFYEN